MDKITRVLFLYSELIKGEEINKTVFCVENDCSFRSFDRDIEDIRLFLSESYSILELIYNRNKNCYYINGTSQQKLEEIEYLLIERLLNDTAVLRQDEMQELMAHLLCNTSNRQSLTLYKNNICNGYDSPMHNKALLKIHGDLTLIIRQKRVIKIKYFKGDDKAVEREIIPCDIKYDLGYLYMVGYRGEEDDAYPAYYRLDRIDSFTIIRNQTDCERKKIIYYLEHYASGITQMFGGKYVEVILECKENYFSYLHDKFKNIKVLEQNEGIIKAKTTVFEEKFVKWFMSQSQDMMTIIQPESTKTRIIEEAKKIINKYGGAF